LLRKYSCECEEPCEVSGCKGWEIRDAIGD
jgi:hypothetical protein